MEEPPFTCPYCDQVLSLPEDVWYYTCEHCRHHLDLKSQFAYLRGLDAFNAGQDILQHLNPRLHQNPQNEQDRAAITFFYKAYSSLQVAFLTELEENQRWIAVEMMTSMAQEFLKRSMISPTEASYWNTLMVEQTAQNEYDLLNKKMGEVNGLFKAIKIWRWRSRQNTIINKLGDINKKIKLLERQIDFLEVPRARNLNWQPDRNH